MPSSSTSANSNSSTSFLKRAFSRTKKDAAVAQSPSSPLVGIGPSTAAGNVVPEVTEQKQSSESNYRSLNSATPAAVSSASSSTTSSPVVTQRTLSAQSSPPPYLIADRHTLASIFSYLDIAERLPCAGCVNRMFRAATKDSIAWANSQLILPLQASIPLHYRRMIRDIQLFGVHSKWSEPSSKSYDYLSTFIRVDSVHLGTNTGTHLTPTLFGLLPSVEPVTASTPSTSARSSRRGKRSSLGDASTAVIAASALASTSSLAISPLSSTSSTAAAPSIAPCCSFSPIKKLTTELWSHVPLECLTTYLAHPRLALLETLVLHGMCDENVASCITQLHHLQHLELPYPDELYIWHAIGNLSQLHTLITLTNVLQHLDRSQVYPKLPSSLTRINIWTPCLPRHDVLIEWTRAYHLMHIEFTIPGLSEDSHDGDEDQVSPIPSAHSFKPITANDYAQCTLFFTQFSTFPSLDTFTLRVYDRALARRAGWFIHDIIRMNKIGLEVDQVRLMKHGLRYISLKRSNRKSAIIKRRMLPVMGLGGVETSATTFERLEGGTCPVKGRGNCDCAVSDDPVGPLHSYESYKKLPTYTCLSATVPATPSSVQATLTTYGALFLLHLPRLSGLTSIEFMGLEANPHVLEGLKHLPSTKLKHLHIEWSSGTPKAPSSPSSRSSNTTTSSPSASPSPSPANSLTAPSPYGLTADDFATMWSALARQTSLESFTFNLRVHGMKKLKLKRRKKSREFGLKIPPAMDDLIGDSGVEALLACVSLQRISINTAKYKCFGPKTATIFAKLPRLIEFTCVSPGLVTNTPINTLLQQSSSLRTLNIVGEDKLAELMLSYPKVHSTLNGHTPPILPKQTSRCVIM